MKYQWVSLAIFVVLSVSGCADSHRQAVPNQVTMQKNTQQAGSWLSVPDGYSDDSFPMRTDGDERMIPSKFPWPKGEQFPDRVQSVNAMILGNASLNSEETIVVQYDTGSGVSNPVICVYKKEGDTAHLSYVWSKLLTSIYGFNSVNVLDKAITLKADFPASGGRKAHYSETSLPLP